MLDSEIVRRGHLMPHQMYEAVKKYETYIACNKRLEGQGASPLKGQQKTSSQASNYKPHFHRTTAFTATVEEPEDEASHQRETLPSEEVDSTEAGPSREEDEGLYIPSYLEETIPNNPVLQVKMACAMQALERKTRRCYRCNKLGHLQKDFDEVINENNGRGPLQPKGPPQNQSAQEKAKLGASRPGRPMPQARPPR